VDLIQKNRNSKPRKWEQLSTKRYQMIFPVMVSAALIYRVFRVFRGFNFGFPV